jgi:hypothetical protein
MFLCLLRFGFITKSYKLGETNMLNNVNEDLRDIAIDLSIDNRIETMAKREAFID